MRVLRLLPCLLLLAAAASGCGYHSLANPRRDGGLPLRVEVRMFENRSPAVGFEALLAEALTEELLRRKQQPIYDAGAGTVDYALSGVVKTVTVRPSSVSSVGLALEYEVVVGLRVYLHRGDGELVWTQRELRDRDRYPASADPGVERSNREQALRRIAAELAGRINDEFAQAL